MKKVLITYANQMTAETTVDALKQFRKYEPVRAQKKFFAELEKNTELVDASGTKFQIV